VEPVQFNTCDAWTATRGKFERYASCTTKQVKNFFIFEIVPVVKDIKKVFPRKVSRRSCLEVFCWSENPAFEGTANYSHL